MSTRKISKRKNILLLAAATFATFSTQVVRADFIASFTSYDNRKLDVFGGSCAPQTPVIGFQDNGAPNQQFYVDAFVGADPMAVRLKPLKALIEARNGRGPVMCLGAGQPFGDTVNAGFSGGVSHPGFHPAPPPVGAVRRLFLQQEVCRGMQGDTGYVGYADGGGYGRGDGRFGDARRGDGGDGMDQTFYLDFVVQEGAFFIRNAQNLCITQTRETVQNDPKGMYALLTDCLEYPQAGGGRPADMDRRSRQLWRMNTVPANF